MAYKKGESGNLKGQSVVHTHKQKLVKELLLKYVPDAVAVIAECLHEDENKTWAAKEVLDRVYGKAAQTVDVGGEAGQALTAVLQIVARDKKD